MFSSRSFPLSPLQSVAASYDFPLIKCPSISNYNNTMHCFKKNNRVVSVAPYNDKYSLQDCFVTSNGSVASLVIKVKRLKCPSFRAGLGSAFPFIPLRPPLHARAGSVSFPVACLDRLVSTRTGKRVGTYDAALPKSVTSQVPGRACQASTS